MSADATRVESERQAEPHFQSGTAPKPPTNYHRKRQDQSGEDSPRTPIKQSGTDERDAVGPGGQLAVPNPKEEQAHTGKVTGEKEANWKTHLRHWLKRTWLYMKTSTGHEDACAFECSNVSGRKCRYWPPLYPKDALKKSRWLQCKRFWTFYIRPGIFMIAAVIFVLYYFATLNNIVTWRTNAQVSREQAHRLKKMRLRLTLCPSMSFGPSAG
jgi:hypothetical protein